MIKDEQKNVFYLKVKTLVNIEQFIMRPPVFQFDGSKYNIYNFKSSVILLWKILRHYGVNLFNGLSVDTMWQW